MTLEVFLLAIKGIALLFAIGLGVGCWYSYFVKGSFELAVILGIFCILGYVVSR